MIEPSTPVPAPTSGPIELDRPEQFPALEENPRTSLWMLATQFFIAPMAIAAAAVAVFVIASMVSTRDTRGVADIVVKIRDGGRNERAQAAYDLAQFLNGLRRSGKPVEEPDRVAITALFGHLLPKELDPNGASSEDDRTILRMVALCQGIVGDPRSGDLLVQALGSRDAELRAYSIFSLGEIAQPRHVPEIAQLLVSDDEAQVRSFAAYAVGYLVRSDATPEMRADAAWSGALARGREALTHAMQRDNDPLVRANAAVGLARTGDAAALPTLAKLIEGAVDVPASGSEAGGPPAPGGPAAPAVATRAQAAEQAIEVAIRLGDPALIPALEKLEASAANLALRVKARAAIAALRAR